MLAAMPDSAPSPLSAGGVSPRAGGDACPGTLRLHRADDGALARVRIPGGVLNPDQADALRAAAERFGDGELHLTSRGNVQLRGLGTECGGELADLLTAAGLLPSAAHERARNIVASPLAGLDGSPSLGPWLTELDALVCGSAAAATLSGRFLFALDDGRGDVDALGADVTLIAEGRSESALLRIGAADEAFRVPAAEAPRAALLAAEEFLRAARDSGAWRVKDLPDDVRTELARTIGSAAGPAVHRPRPRTATPPAPGPHGSAITAGVPLGRLTPAQWRLLTETARRYGGELRLTPWRGIVIPGPVPRPEAAEALRTLSGSGLITAPDSPWTGVGACIGHPGCAKSLSDVRAEAGAAVGRPGRLPVYWSGCERRCGHPHGEWIDVVVTPDGHRISHVRGERRDPPTTVRNDPAALAAAVATARA
ncbi:Cobalamin biosynthesis protein CobG,precorrin-3Bsynthase [Streptomyces microflavus DSM 40593]|uniref:Cobalamin biosynthesis protein CobG,precorrin-3Bsynthase n=1 Tax=Streptomyces microflavus DSM 40593 TaxID=1303692 RepID=N0CRC8_STRMI|nr:nitrite/sulfite reductase [Streptomyces microflavus]AGK78736.1 Cobalamin biosynthesis protein CobG,precorrin-3Bsynthase [Streptomyces microflavus DSM 40593]